MTGEESLPFAIPHERIIRIGFYGNSTNFCTPIVTMASQHAVVGALIALQLSLVCTYRQSEGLRIEVI